MSPPEKEKRAPAGNALVQTANKLPLQYRSARRWQASLAARLNRTASTAELAPRVLAAMLAPSVARLSTGKRKDQP